MVKTRLKNLRKTFNDGAVVAVDGIDLEIEEGELVVLVGPSGCGKSTTMRCIAGLERPDSGQILFGDTDVVNYAPKDRRVAMVFQNYALYPSMTVYENMAFGLRMRGADQETIDDQVRWAAGVMNIEDLLNRFPSELSGGQQQRVALGRSIVREPVLFLLDEPLSNLDAKLRAIMRTEIQELQRELGVATVFVTHDQEEAMTMGDRIAVMNAGRIEQISKPEDVYHNPKNLFVADFIGNPSMNFFELQLDGTRLVSETLEIDLPRTLSDTLEAELPGDDLILGVRPENVNLTEPGSGDFDADIDVIEPIGDRKIIHFETERPRWKAVVPSSLAIEEKETTGIELDRDDLHFFDPDGPKVAKWSNVVGDRSKPLTED